MSSTNTNSDASSDGTKTSNPAQLHSKRPNPRPPNQPFPLSYPPTASTSARKARPASSDLPSSPSHQQEQPQHAHPRPSPRDRRNSLLLQSHSPLNIPIPPTLRDSPFVHSPKSIFRRPYSSTPHSPSKEEDRWLGDTVPMNVDSANFQRSVSNSGSLRRMEVNAGESSELGASEEASLPSEVVAVSKEASLKDSVSSPPPFPSTSSIAGKVGHSDGDGKRPLNSQLQTNIGDVDNERR